MKEQVQKIRISDLPPFRNHPFYVKNDEAMRALCDSIREYGVLSPLLARPTGESYEIVSVARQYHFAFFGKFAVAGFSQNSLPGRTSPEPF